MASLSLDVWPKPLAGLLNRAQLAKDPKTQHDLMLSAWEATVRLQVMRSPPADRSVVASPSLGHWVAALPDAAQRARSPHLTAMMALLAAEAGGAAPRDEKVSLRQLVRDLPAYRNRVHGHGAPRSGPFYERSARVLLEGLEAARSGGLLWAEGERLIAVDEIVIDAAGDRRARWLSVMGLAVTLADRGVSVAETIRSGQLYWESRGELRPLFPWLLWLEQEDRHRVLFFTEAHRGLAYLDYETGETIKGAALRALAPTAEDPTKQVVPGVEQNAKPPPAARPGAASSRIRWIRTAAAGLVALALAGSALGFVLRARGLAREDWFYWDRREGWGWSDRCWNHMDAGRLAEAEAACRKGLEVVPPTGVATRALRYNMGLIAEGRGDLKNATRWTAQALNIERHPEIVAALERMCIASGAPARQPGEQRQRMVVRWPGKDGATIRSAPSTGTSAVGTVYLGTCLWGGKPTDTTIGRWFPVEALTSSGPLQGWIHGDLLEPKNWAEAKTP